MNNENKVKLIEGNIFIDDRGEVSFVNDFGENYISEIKRFYMVSNHKKDFIRAWHGHKQEAKYVLCLKGSAWIRYVKIDDWKNPSKDLKVEQVFLSDKKPTILYIPGGYVNGFMSLTDDMKLMFFSPATLEESLKDDFRFPYDYWDNWQVKPR
jgi:dTDP-4-dehydrorhamnose 3,5-epimerase-like enzyme